MIDDEFKKLDLNFDEGKKKSKLNKIKNVNTNKEEINNEPIDELINDSINKKTKDIDNSINKRKKHNNSINNLETKPDLNNELLHSFIDKPIKFITEEAKLKKRWKGETSKSIVRKSLFLLIFWSLILFFTIIFGANSIWLTVKNISSFAQDINNDNINKAIGSFFLIFAHVCEALMFLFFILLSFVKLIYNSKPWFKYRKLTSHDRKEKRKAKKEKKEIKKEKRIDKNRRKKEKEMLRWKYKK